MPVNVVATSLMPISQAVSWTLVLQQGPPNYPVLAGVAGFYCAWALYNRYLNGIPQELGQYSMGCMVIAGLCQHRFASLAACGLILLNFGAALGLVGLWNAETLARRIKKDTRRISIVWAYIFKLYLISNLALWSTVFYKIYIDQPYK